MLGNGGLSQRQNLRDVLASAIAVQGNVAQNIDPRRIGKRRKYRSHLGGILNPGSGLARSLVTARHSGPFHRIITINLGAHKCVFKAANRAFPSKSRGFSLLARPFRGF